MKFITLKQITDEVENRQEPDVENNDLGEDDGMAPPSHQVQAGDARSSRSRSGAFISWKPMTLAVDSIRNFYPRAGGREGTRILLKSGVKYIVLNEHDEIVEALGGDVVNLARPPEQA